MQPTISHKSSSGIWNTSDWTYFTEQSDSDTRMYLFKVLKRQATDIINIINVPVFLLLTFNSYQHLPVFVVAVWNLLLYIKTLPEYCTITEIEVSYILSLDFFTGI